MEILPKVHAATKQNEISGISREGLITSQAAHIIDATGWAAFIKIPWRNKTHDSTSADNFDKNLCVSVASPYLFSITPISRDKCASPPGLLARCFETHEGDTLQSES